GRRGRGRAGRSGEPRGARGGDRARARGARRARAARLRACPTVQLAPGRRDHARGLRGGLLSPLTHSRPMRVGIDVSPLAQTRAGTARYLRALLRELGPPAVEVRRFGFGGGRRAATLARELAWYP